MISLGLPLALLLLPLPALVWFLAPPLRRTIPALRFPFFRQITEAAGTPAREGAVVATRRRTELVTAAIVWTLMVLALAQPERVGEPVERTRAARDIVLAIDISGSMDTRDFAPGEQGGAGDESDAGDSESAAAGGDAAQARQPLQRLAAVRDVVSSFVEAREDDRMALIVFGSKAYVQAPLTEDLQTIIDLLARTEVGMAGPHTALGDAIGLAIRTFEASEIEERVLILLSDGSDTASRMSPINAAEIASGKGVEIFTIGVGDPDATGEARVDLTALQDIAARTGGAYFFAADSAALGAIYDRIDALNPRVTETLSFRPRQSLAHWPAGAALIIGILACLVAHRRQRAQSPSWARSELRERRA